MSQKNTGTVADIMNKKLLYVREGDRIVNVRRHILRFGVTAVPVLDAGHLPVGMVSLSDISRDETEALETSLCRVACAKATDSIRRGAELLAESPYHHLVVVDDEGVAVGIVSSVDFLRALLDLPPRHPAAFEQY
jgi:CBS-domain-containing membrane protein